MELCRPLSCPFEVRGKKNCLRFASPAEASGGFEAWNERWAPQAGQARLQEANIGLKSAHEGSKKHPSGCTRVSGGQTYGPKRSAEGSKRAFGGPRRPGEGPRGGPSSGDKVSGSQNVPHDGQQRLKKRPERLKNGPKREKNGSKRAQKGPQRKFGSPKRIGKGHQAAQESQETRFWPKTIGFFGFLHIRVAN